MATEVWVRAEVFVVAELPPDHAGEVARGLLELAAERMHDGQRPAHVLHARTVFEFLEQARGPWSPLRSSARP